MQVLEHGKVVGTSQKWPAKAGGRSPKGPAVAGTTVSVLVYIEPRHLDILRYVIEEFCHLTNG